MKYTVAEPKWLEKYSRWQLKVQKNGERRTFTCPIAGRKGKAEITARALEWLKSMDTDNIRLYAAWDRFMADQKANTSKSSWLKHDSVFRTHIKPNIVDKRLAAVTPYEWQNVINTAAQQGITKRTCQNIRASIIRFRSFCDLNRFEHDIPSSVILSVPKNVRSGEREILQPHDLKVLFTTDTMEVRSRGHKQHTEQIHYIYAWRFLVATGLRPGEMIALERDSVKDGILHVRHSVNVLGELTDGKNENAVRQFALTPLAQSVLADQNEMLKGKGIVSPYLFPSADGSRTDPAKLGKEWIKARKAMGITASMYEMRHTYISIVKSDMPDPLLRATVGHSTHMDTYKVYGHELEGDMQRAAEMAGAAFDRVLKAEKKDGLKDEMG